MVTWTHSVQGNVRRGRHLRGIVRRIEGSVASVQVLSGCRGRHVVVVVMVMVAEGVRGLPTVAHGWVYCCSRCVAVGGYGHRTCRRRRGQVGYGVERHPGGRS